MTISTQNITNTIKIKDETLLQVNYASDNNLHNNHHQPVSNSSSKLKPRKAIHIKIARKEESVTKLVCCRKLKIK